MATHLARLTQEPGVVREVDDASLLDAARLGFLHSYEHTDEASAVLEGTAVKVSKWKAPGKGDDIVTAPVDTTDSTKGE